MEPNEARDALLKNFREHPECANTEQSARGLIMDSIPQCQAEKNILITLYRDGLVEALKTVEEIGIVKHRFMLVMTRDYGFSDSISEWCIDTWILIIAGESGEKSVEDIISHELTVVKSEYERLLEEIRNLKALIVALTAERDELKFHVCMDLAAEYNSRIGDIELQVLNAKLHVMELKRIIEILQAQINRQERKSEKKAREQARQEYKEFEEDLNQKAEEARNANRYRQDEEEKEREWQKEQEEKEKQEENEESTSDNRKKYKSRSDEMKALYRRIVKALHPDMNPDITPAEKDMFQQAVDAYNNGDLDKLREIAALIDEGQIEDNPLDNSSDSIERLREILNGLKLHIDELQEEIEEIKTSFPYTMKEFLNDEKAVSRKQKELTELLYEYNDQIASLEKRLDEMLGKKV